MQQNYNTRTYIWLILCEEERERLWKTRWWTLLLPTLRYRVLTLFQIWPKHFRSRNNLICYFESQQIICPPFEFTILCWPNARMRENKWNTFNKRVNGTKPLHCRLFVYNYKADIGFISDQTDMSFVFWANLKKKNIKSHDHENALSTIENCFTSKRWTGQ